MLLHVYITYNTSWRGASRRLPLGVEDLGGDRLLWCTIVWYTIIYYTILYCTILYYNVSYYTIV